jgi:hypothetical protein
MKKSILFYSSAAGHFSPVSHYQPATENRLSFFPPAVED